MNLIDFEAFAKAKKELSFRRPMYYSVLFSVIIFIILLFSGQAGLAFGVMIFMFIFLFGLTYIILYFTTKSVLRKTQKFNEPVPHLNVTFNISGMMAREEGMLCLYDDHIVYKGLQVGAVNKEVAIEITEDLMIAYGEFKHRKRDKYVDGPYQKCHITVREMPRGMVRQFVFHNIDNALEKVGERLNQINRFNREKYQQ